MKANESKRYLFNESANESERYNILKRMKAVKLIAELLIICSVTKNGNRIECLKLT